MHMIHTITVVVLVRVVLGYIVAINVCNQKCSCLFCLFCVHILVVLATVFITRYVPTLSSTQTPHFRPLCQNPQFWTLC